MSGIYLHIPFCKQACSYCDFYFVTRQALKEQYVERLIQEIEGYRNTGYAEEPVQTIYFGGGTPSLLSAKELDTILSSLQSAFKVEAEEITLEMNPDDVTADYLSGLKQAGINRASMGVQSFQPKLLQFMNRAHTRDEALRCLELLSASGFKSFTVDLIYGNPGQTLQQLSDDLDMLLDFNPPHISAYSLTVEPDTRLGKQVELGRIVPPEDDTVADQFELINERLREKNIQRYEVSNYSKPGAEALHNSSYWSHENYLGFGPGAHSFWWDEQPRRWQNKADIKIYCSSDSAKEEAEQLSMNALAEERIMMGLRTRRGISEKEMETKYDYIFTDRQKKYLKKQQEQGHLHYNDTIKLTDPGIVIADAIILDLITLH
jgi:oxygen-independent coproporphyrinogen-3 oxidase